MIQELLYTSAPRGLKPGSRGFCTVLSTSGMPAPVATALESLSGYRPVFPPGDAQAKLNPVVYSHLKMSLGGRRSDVLSRVADYGLDYSQRTNKIAHHLIVDPSDRPAVGPAWILAHPDVMRTDWAGEPHIVSGERSLPQGKSHLRICSAWKELTGDAGWAGVLAESFLKKPDQPAYIVFSPGMNLLPLIEEALALLSPNRRWDVSFSTYFTKVPNGVTCNWRCVLADSPEAKESRRYVQSLRIDLTEPLGEATGGELVETARTGRAPVEGLQEPSVSTTPEVKGTHQEASSAAGAVPPIRVRGGRSVPIPRKRVSEYPVGQAEKAHDGKSRSWFKWVVAIALLAMFGGGAVAIKTGWRPLGGETTSSPVTHAEGSSSISDASQDASQDRQGAPGMEQRDVEAKNHGSTSGGTQLLTVPEENNRISASGSTNAMPADKTSPNGKANAMGSTDAINPEAPPAGTNDANKKDQQPKPSPREDCIHWSAAPQQLQVNHVYEIPLPDWITPDTAKVTAWCPTDQAETFTARNNKIQYRESLTRELADAIVATMVSKEGKMFLQLKANVAMSSKDYSRIAFGIDQSGHEIPLYVLLSSTTKFSSNNKIRKSYDTELMAMVSVSQPADKMKLRLESISFLRRNEPGRIELSDKKVDFAYNGSSLMATVKTSVSSIVDKQISQDLSELPIGVQTRVSQIEASTQLMISILYAEFEGSAKNKIDADISDISSGKLSGDISVDSGMLKKSITDPEWISHLESKKEKSRKGAEPNGSDGKMRDDSQIKVAREQLERLDKVIAFCKIAARITNEFEKCELHELIISQECRNGDETKFIPFVVYRRDVTDTNQVSE